jgi:hypothetical protein
VIQSAVRWLLVSCVVTALLACFSLSYRYRAEPLNRAVGVTLELDTVADFAASSNLSVAEALGQLKSAGLTGVVMSEETIGDLVSDGRASLVPQAILLTNEDTALRARIAQGLERRFNMFVPNGGSTIPIGGLSGSLARTVAISIDAEAANEIRGNGLFIVARMSNPAGVSSDYVRKTIAAAAEAGTGFFLPQGDQVLGRRDALPVLLESLAQSKILYATPEFAKIGGDANVVAKAPEQVVRLHAAQAAEIDKLTLGGALERYGKAAAERNQRILLLRPLSYTSDPPMSGLTDFVNKVSAQLRKEGLVPGTPHAFTDPGTPSWLLALLAISVLPALWFGAQLSGINFFNLGSRLALILAVAAVVSGVTEAGRNYAALVAAMLYPVLAFMLLVHAPPKNVLSGYLRTSLISLVGGLVVAGLLNGLPFLVKADSFSGVKLAHFAPIAFIGIWFWMRNGQWRSAMVDPVRWGQALLGFVLLTALLFMATRTGNDSPAGVSGVEMQFRALLDQWLYVRPRTKEFLIGHPALVILLGALIARRSETLASGWLAIGAMVAAIGQTSLVNTLCHLHTPLAVGLTRILVGLVLGGIIGALGWGAWSRFATAHK